MKKLDDSQIVYVNIEKQDYVEPSTEEVKITEEENWFEILEYTQGGRVKRIRFGNVEIPGTEARTIFGLKSANFNISVENGNIKFTVIGYGHGVGMSQTGADCMAKQGSNYEEIIKHYYTGVEIENIS